MYTVFTKSNRLMPANQFQVPADKIICNDVELPKGMDDSYLSGLMKMWIIGGAFGVSHCIFASCEQSALDESCDADLLNWCLPDNQDYDDESFTSLGNAGDLFDLPDVWMAEVDLKIERDFMLILKLVRAQERGTDNLDF